MTTEQYILQLYEEGRSPYEIAEILGREAGWNHMKVRRLIAKIGVPVRDKGAAQKAALASGRAKSPRSVTKGPAVSYNIEDTQPAEGMENNG